MTMFSALTAKCPPDPPTELNYTSFWEKIGSCLPTYAADVLNFDAVCLRNVNDDSITMKDKKRDYMVVVKGVMVVGGEFKATEGQYRDCMEDLQKKHAGSSPALYGRLEYILLVAMTGKKMSVHAISVTPADRGEPSRAVVPIIWPFDVVESIGRRKALRLWINITRWLRTVHDSDALPPKPSHPLFKAFKRASPYQAILPEEYAEEEVSLKIGLRVVDKQFVVPGSHLRTLMEVYKCLQQLDLPTAVKCVRFKVDGDEIDLKSDRTPRIRGQGRLYDIDLTLKPVGAQWSTPDDRGLKALAIDLLRTLGTVHSHGVVHRDIRRENIVKVLHGWVLIDWELAGRAGEVVWWRSDNLPPGVLHNHEPYTVQGDLWQVGRLILSLCSKPSSLTQLAAGLQTGLYPSAIEAANAIQL